MKRTCLESFGRERRTPSRRTVARALQLLSCALGALVLLLATPSLAQRANRDYYDPMDTDRELRRNVETYHLKPGIDEMRSGRWHAARAHFEFILNYYPNHPAALNLLSELCDVRWIDVRCDSDTRFAKAVERNPAIPQTYVVYGIHLQRRKQLDQAIDAFNRALAMNPRLLDAHYNLALAYLDKREFVLANRHAQISYSLGAPLPGLKNRLVAAKKWQELPPEEISRYLAPEKAPGGPS